ncbi:MAG: GWxTD domain-containing protein [Gemmatimonadales bacterium]|nr:GWxTD domain-containing protein [Gemmatimonadales bacterium]
MIGRYRAESLLTRAGALDPSNPEPFYYLGKVGLALRGDDGEMISRPALVHVLELDPHYRDAWALWTTLYRGDAERRAAVTALARHAGDGVADLWRAGLLVELRRYDEAVSLLAEAIGAAPRDPAPRGLLARLLFEQRRDDEGARAYDSALRVADRDTGGVLWRQVRSIATPAERGAYGLAAPEEREALLRLFWARREPDLRTPLNERIGEHFRRMMEARRAFALLHPNSRFHHSRSWRTLAGGLGAPPGADLEAISRGVAEGRATRVTDAPVAAGLGGRLDGDSEETANLEDYLDDRGRIFVRYGTPGERLVWGLDTETWRYYLPDGMLQVTFARRTGGFGFSGDQVVTPVVAGELESARRLLATDRPDLDARLSFVFWPAAFRHGVDGVSELVLFPSGVDATAVLLDGGGREVARDTATGRALHLVAPPGRYVLALDAERDERIGRFRGAVQLPRFGADSLAVSSLLIAAGAVPPERGALERAAPAGLRLRADTPMRFYAEVYGLGGADGMSRYQATYRFEREGGGFLGLRGRERITSVSLTREQPADMTIMESLVIDPGRLPRGHYRMHLEILDAVRGTRAASASLEFDLR